VSISDTPLPDKSEKFVIPIPDKSEAAILFGHPCGITRHSPDFYAYALMNHVLGGGGALGSRLGKVIRDDLGLAYDVYSNFDATLGEGAWYASIGCNPSNVDKAVGALKGEVEKYAATGPTRKEFDEAKEFIIGFFPIRLETNAGVARVLLNAEFYGLGMDYIENYPKIYRAVTLDRVKEVAGKYLQPDKALLIIAGSYGASDSKK
jgi:zinc protease